MAKKKQNSLKECAFCYFDTQNTVPWKYTPTDCFFSDFAHWERFQVRARSLWRTWKRAMWSILTDDGFDV